MYPTQTETQIQTPAEAPATVTPQLTQREHDLVRALTRGLSNRQIAAEFSLSEQTVKNQLTRIYQKLRIRNRLQLVVYALKNDLA